MSLPHTFFIGRGSVTSYPSPIYAFNAGSDIIFENFGATIASMVGTTLSAAKNGLNGAAHHASWRTNSSRFNVTIAGYQDWLVPVSGVWELTARGAAGGKNTSSNYSSNGGAGGGTRARFNLPAGSALRIICGAKGSDENAEGSGGGGGGTFIFYGSGLASVGSLNTVANKQFYYGSGTNAQKLSQVLVVGGGGGGGAHSSTGVNDRVGQPAYAGSESLGGNGRGNHGTGFVENNGLPAGGSNGFGTNGSGGTPYLQSNGAKGAWSGGGGSGILGDGTEAQQSSANVGDRSKDYDSGFIGGSSAGASYGVNGGFGGGGAGSWGGAGGGGYSGGEADYDSGQNATACGGGGGGNYINTNFSVASEGALYVSQNLNNPAFTSSHGQATIKLIETL